MSHRNDSNKAFEPRLYWERRLGQDYSLQGVGYYRLGRRYNDWMYWLRKKIFSRLLDELEVYSWQDKSVLDIGCGTGFYTQLWSDRGIKELVGIDITDVAVMQLRQKFSKFIFKQLDVGDELAVDSLQHRQFDFISAMDVLFHIVDDKAYKNALNNISRLLHPNGLFIWSDNFVHSAIDRIEHQVSRTLDDITRLLESAGLEVVKRTPMFFIMNYPADVKYKFLQLLWKISITPALVSETAGGVIGSVYAYIDLILTKLKKESPSTEIMICRKKGG